MARLLFFYATNNCGHQKAAEAIQRSIARIAPGVATLGIDFFTYHYPNIGPVLSKLYVELMRHIPLVWDEIYDNPEVAARTEDLRRFFAFINVSKIHEDIRCFRPDAIVCTQAVPAGFIASEKEKGELSALPLFVALTDFVANPYWPSRQVAGYFVPDREVKGALLKRSIEERLIHVTGIPIDASFTKEVPDSASIPQNRWRSSWEEASGSDRYPKRSMNSSPWNIRYRSLQSRDTICRSIIY